MSPTGPAPTTNTSVRAAVEEFAEAIGEAFHFMDATARIMETFDNYLQRECGDVSSRAARVGAKV